MIINFWRFRNIKILSDIDGAILKSYCAYSSIGRICNKFPNSVESLLIVLSNSELDESKVIFELNKTCKSMVPYVLVLLKYISKFDYIKLKYLFDENMYFDEYMSKLFFNKKLNKKDLVFKEFIDFLFLDVDFNRKYISNVKKMIITKNKLFDSFYNLDLSIDVNFIFLNTIEGISSGYGNHNYIIVESNIYPELIVIHELVHILNYNSSEFNKFNKIINVFEFNEAFTNLVSSIIYLEASFDINKHKFYYSSKKGIDLENKIYSIYKIWKISNQNISFISFLSENF